MQKDLILLAKEEALKKVKKLLKPNNAVVLIKANIPGENKNSKEAYMLIRLFEKECLKILNVSYRELVESPAGPYILLVTLHNEEIKKKLIEIENIHTLGRMIDLDYFLEEGKSISRTDLGLPLRKCYLCEKEAAVCIREHAHNEKRIFTFIQTQVYAYVQDILEKIIFASIKKELDLEDKFGLVTPKSCGSHIDMNYQLMIRSAKALLFSFTQMFWIGYDSPNLDQAYQYGKKQGLSAEKVMYEVTDDVNTYKGLIFLLGLILLSSGYALSHQQSINDIFSNVAYMTKNIFNEPMYNTFGEKAYREYKIGGARAEAYMGCPTVLNTYQYLSSVEEINDEVLHMALIKIISTTDDTVMLKRAGSLEEYKRIKNKISSIKEYDLSLIKEITEELIKDNISCGGAADILVTSLYLVMFEEKFLTE